MAEGGSNEKSGIVSDDLEEYRIVALGKNGSGKSATGNSILGHTIFISSCSAKSVTVNCQCGSAARFGKRLVYVDTPGFFDIERSNEIIQKEIIKCIALSSPGPHVFLLMIKVDRFTPEEKETIDLYEKIFGHEFYHHLIVIFTHKDKLDKSGKSLQQFIAEAPSDLQNVLRRNNNICIAIDNGASSEDVELQVNELFTLVTVVVGLNRGKHFTNTTYANIEERLLKEEDKEIKSYKETLTKVIQDKSEMIDILMQVFTDEQQLLPVLVESLSMNTELSSTKEAQSVEVNIKQLYSELEKLRNEISKMKEEIRRIGVESRERSQKPGWFRENIRKIIESETGQLVASFLDQLGPILIKWGIESFKGYMKK